MVVMGSRVHVSSGRAPGHGTSTTLRVGSAVPSELALGEQAQTYSTLVALRDSPSVSPSRDKNPDGLNDGPSGT